MVVNDIVYSASQYIYNSPFWLVVNDIVYSASQWESTAMTFEVSWDIWGLLTVSCMTWLLYRLETAGETPSQT